MNLDDISKCHMSDPKDLRQTERKSAVRSKRLEFPVGECRMIHVEANFRPACGYRLHTSTASTCHVHTKVYKYKDDYIYIRIYIYVLHAPAPPTLGGDGGFGVRSCITLVVNR